MAFFVKLWKFLTSWREDLHAQFSNYLVTREVARVLENTHAQELAITPRNEWALVRQKQIEEIKAVRSGQVFDIVDRRSWSYPYLPECLDTSSEILTRDGFKGVKEISKDDLVATLNPETNELQYFHPKKIIKQSYSGKMLHFKGRGFDLMVTPNHRMVGKWTWLNYATGSSNRKEYKWKGFKDRYTPDSVRGKHGRIGLSATTFATAKEIKDYRDQNGNEYGFEVPFGSKWKGLLPESYNPKTGRITIECGYSQDDGKRWKRDYDDVRVSLEDYVAFLGIYIAEGGCAGNYQGVTSDKTVPKYIGAIAARADNTVYDRSTGYWVQVSQKPSSRHYRKIEKLLTSLPFDFERLAKNGWRSNSRALHSAVFECGNTYTKKIPQWVKDLPPKYLQILLDWYTKGDGLIRKSGARENFTVSEQLANDLQEVYLKAGSQARVRKGKSTGAYWGHDPKRLAPKYTIEENLGRFTRLPRPREVSYTGCVWCVDIPPNATIFVRRGGKGVWTGNSLHRLNQPV